jgi:hypothetical protein
VILHKTVIFSKKEGFWNDDNGWSFCPTKATFFDEPAGETATFIGIDDAIYVNPSHYSHIDHDAARELFFDSLYQYSGEQIGLILTDLSDTEFNYEDDGFWLVGDRTFDDDNIKSFISEDADIDNKLMLELLNQHSNGTFYPIAPSAPSKSNEPKRVNLGGGERRTTTKWWH